MYDAYSGELWRALLVVSGGRPDLAWEGVSEAFARWVGRGESVRSPRAWLYRTGSRVVIDELRREARRGHAALAADRSEPAPVFSDRLVLALRVLSPQQRLAVFLTYALDLPLREVAALSGVPTATVKVRLHRARAALRAQLEESDVYI